MLGEDALVLRPMRVEDLPAIAAFAQAQGRNVHPDDYERFLALEGAHGVVLTRDEVLVGAATAIRYFEHGFLGPVLVPPQGDGLAVALLVRLVEGLQRDGAIVIEAEASDVEGPILARMGFAAIRRTLVLEREPGAESPQGGTRPMEAIDALDVGALDAGVAGWGRKEYLLALQRDMPQGARVIERDGEVDGYVLLRRSRRGYHLGPLVTRTPTQEAAEALVADALREARGWPVVALVPEGGPLLPILVAHGFAEVGLLTRMRAGTHELVRAEGVEWAVGSRMTG